MLQSINDKFNEMLGDIDPYAHTEYALRVGCVKMAAPRHERFDMIREFGIVDINNLFEGREFSSSELTFVFPERYMSMHEQHAFMAALEKHPHFSKVKKLDIITSSALILGSFRRESIRILSWEDDEKHSGKIQTN